MIIKVELNKKVWVKILKDILYDLEINKFVWKNIFFYNVMGIDIMLIM